MQDSFYSWMFDPVWGWRRFQSDNQNLGFMAEWETPRTPVIVT